MDATEQRIAIAEACGWTRASSESGAVTAWQNGPEYRTSLPDYLHDLNAMHEAEKVLTRPQSERYVACFSNIMDMEEAMRVPARQRAEAFLRAINKWEDN